MDHTDAKRNLKITDSDYVGKLLETAKERYTKDHQDELQNLVEQVEKAWLGLWRTITTTTPNPPSEEERHSYARVAILYGVLREVLGMYDPNYRGGILIAKAGQRYLQKD